MGQQKPLKVPESNMNAPLKRQIHINGNGNNFGNDV